MNKILKEEVVQHLQRNLMERLSGVPDFQNRRINSSPRAIGDTVQQVVGELLPDCFPRGLLDEFSADFARRAMADVAFTDVDGNYYLVDIKTHNISTEFNMPNITSVQRLAHFYEDDKNFFIVLLIEYTVENGCLTFTGVQFVPIEYLSWSCLTIGALGWGQIQIANSNIVHINKNNTRKEWMLSLCNVLDTFYPKEIAKITKRLEFFQTVRQQWQDNNQ